MQNHPFSILKRSLHWPSNLEYYFGFRLLKITNKCACMMMGFSYLSFYFFQKMGRRYRILEMETWHDLANIYTMLSQWRDAEVCLSKSKAITQYSASGWHSEGTNLIWLSHVNIICTWLLQSQNINYIPL